MYELTVLPWQPPLPLIMELRLCKLSSLSLMFLLQDLWNGSRFLFFVVVIVPMFVFGLVIYTLCCLSWSDEGEEEEADESEGEDDGGSEQGVEGKLEKCGELCMADLSVRFLVLDSDHLKKE